MVSVHGSDADISPGSVFGWHSPRTSILHLLSHFILHSPSPGWSSLRKNAYLFKLLPNGSVDGVVTHPRWEMWGDLSSADDITSWFGEMSPSSFWVFEDLLSYSTWTMCNKSKITHILFECLFLSPTIYLINCVKRINKTYRQIAPEFSTLVLNKITSLSVRVLKYVLVFVIISPIMQSWEFTNVNAHTFSLWFQ